MQREELVLTLVTPDVDGICESQKPASGGLQYLILNGALVGLDNIAVLDIQRRITITSDNDDSGRKFTILGVDWTGNVIIEEIAGPATATVVSNSDFKSVTKIIVDDNVTGNIIVGTNDQASSRWVITDHYRDPFSIGLTVSLSASAVLNYTVEYTHHDFRDRTGSPTPDPNTIFNYDDPALVNSTIPGSGNFAHPILGYRLTLNSFISGEVTLVGVQAG